MRWSWGFFHLCNRLAKFQKLDNKLYWQDCRKIILLYCCWWEYEFGRILMEGYQTVSFKYISHWPSSSTSRNLCYIYTNVKWIKLKDVTCSMVVMEKICQQPKCSSTGDWLGFPDGAVVESLPANAGDTGSSPGLGRSHMPRSN